ncbi:unnamed protein product [Schistosoma margrebowiei]|uniref:Uncharacterized protein n=1 Tax=Schistosoma margrebowiei TaxID=48269 RepID=A0A183N6V2_9TREM|nr:unnamed protein product [Schistosoma margrebowiei]
MKTSTSEGNHGIQWTSRIQLDDLDFADDLALLSQTQRQMQEKTTSAKRASAATSTSEGKHGIQWTAQNQLDDLDFADDLALLSHTHEQMNSQCSSSLCISRPQYTQRENQSSQIQSGKQQSSHS